MYFSIRASTALFPSLSVTSSPKPISEADEPKFDAVIEPEEDEPGEDEP
jgi:hypothetical protein